MTEETAAHTYVLTESSRITKRHICKSWSHFFQAIKAGDKKHDLRFDGDRGFSVGDEVLLREYDNINGVYTGEECLTKVTYLTSREVPCAFSSAVLDRDYVILSLEPIRQRGRF